MFRRGHSVSFTSHRLELSCFKASFGSTLPTSVTCDPAKTMFGAGVHAPSHHAPHTTRRSLVLRDSSPSLDLSGRWGGDQPRKPTVSGYSSLNLLRETQAA